MKCDVQKLRELRAERNLSDEKLAEATGLSGSVIKSVEETGTLSFEIGSQFAKALGVDLNVFTDADVVSPVKGPREIKIGVLAKMDLGRRDFIFLSIASLSALFAGSNLALNQLQRHSDEAKVALEQRELAFSLLFGQSDEQFIRTSTNNPYSITKGTTLPTFDALNSIMSNFSGIDTHFKELRNEEVLSNVNGSIVLLGGPVANIYSRQVFGVGDGSLLFKRAYGRRIDLPVYFDNVLSKVSGPGTRPEYRVIADGRSIGVRETGDQNYLVLTSIPKVFSKFYGIFDHRIVIVSGLNGVGTRAIHQVLRNPGMMDRLRKETIGMPAWQALIHVNEIDKERQLPIRVGECRVWGINHVDFDKIHEVVKDECFWVDPNDPLIKI